MSFANTKELEEFLSTQLKQRFAEVDTQKGSRFGRGIYSPQPDISVGPYSLEEGVNLNDEYMLLFEQHKEFFLLYEKYHMENCIAINNSYTAKFDAGYNTNPRCFIAVEIERSGSSKHLLGDLVNAASLGKVGIVVAWNDEVLRKFMRILEYFSFLRETKRLPFASTNLLLMTSDQISQI